MKGVSKLKTKKLNKVTKALIISLFSYIIVELG